MWRRGSLVLTFILPLLVVACGGDDESETTTVRGTGRAIRKPVPKPTARAPGVAGAPGEVPEADLGSFTYKPGRDPFQSYFDITSEQAEITRLEPLQRHELSKLKVAAIISGTVQPAAVVLDPAGKPHTIRRGTYLGPPKGRVARILSDRVVVEREYKDRMERVHKLVHELKIRPDEEEQREAQR
jgi:Tfp pilus assembly protein PilP